MLSHLVPMLCLLQSTDALPITDIQRDGLVAVWVAPQTSREVPLPVGFQAGLQLGPWLMVTASYGELPIANIESSGWTIGARWYLGLASLSPFLTAELGGMEQQQDDTGGRKDSYSFGVMGVGIEKVWLRHLSLSTDLQAGPGRRESGSYHPTTTVFWLQYRIALGVRF